ncbi:hypothetical protein MXB_1975 [Myxobolus squamalis]|nr:hypothetical protein MXB_1975 [Myxobolus squamalis]
MNMHNVVHVMFRLSSTILFIANLGIVSLGSFWIVLFAKVCSDSKGIVLVFPQLILSLFLSVMIVLFFAVKKGRVNRFIASHLGACVIYFFISSSLLVIIILTQKAVMILIIIR